MNFYSKSLHRPRAGMEKILLVMRLIIVLLTTAILQVSASSYGQSVTLKRESASLVNVFTEIRKQTGYDFFYSDKMMASAKPISINLKQVNLEEALDIIFENQALQYELKDKTVIIKEKTPSFLDNIIARITAIDVRGRILDSETNEPLSGATVSVQGKPGKSTMTNAEGEFFLQDVEEGAIILISFVGYRSFYLPAAKMMGTIKMEMGSSDLQEVTINKGYYTTTQRLNTGSVSKVTAEVIGRQPVNDPLLALQGRVPGLYIEQTSGIPGSFVSKILLRGKNSIANGNDPLFIVDGNPVPSQTMTNSTTGGGISRLSPFTSINPKDIESIEVLKDADATALYGTRGANGVVLITTKRGLSGKTIFDLDVYRGITRATKLPKFANTEQYMQIRKEAFKNDGVSYGLNDYDVNNTWDQNRYTDWGKKFLGGKSDLTNLQAGISGGNERTQFRISGNLNTEDSIFPGDYLNKTGSGIFNFNHNAFNQKLSLSFNGRYSKNKSVIPSVKDPAYYLTIAPNAPDIYNEFGDLNWENETWDNPLADLKSLARANTTSLSSNLNIKYELFPGFDFSSHFGYSTMGMDQSIIIPSSSLTPSQAAISSNRSNTLANTDLMTWIVEPQFSFKKPIGKGELEAFLGTSFQERLNGSGGITGSDFPTDQQIENINRAVKIILIPYAEVKYRQISSRVRLAYNWNKKYLINFTGSREGSTRFGVGSQFGNFGAIGAAWIFSEESFFRNNLSFLSFGKLRGSYGVTGNDQLGDYEFLSTYQSIYTGQPRYLDSDGIEPSRIANPYFGWEHVKKLELAAELSFFEDKINAILNYYRNISDNQLVRFGLPDITGFTSIRANLPAIVQNTGVELQLNTTNLKGRYFQWTSTFNLTFPRNKLVAYPDIEKSAYINTYMVGMPLFVSKRYNYSGIDPQTGIYKFKDINEDGTINSTFDREFVENGLQRYYGGFQNGFTYKGFNLDVFFQFAKKTASILPTAAGFMNNFPIENLNRWKNPGDDALLQKTTRGNFQTVTAFSNYLASDAVIRDFLYARLKNVAFSYTLNDSFTKKMVHRARLYLQCQNLFTITNLRGPDPEIETYYSMPPLQAITLGIQIQL